MIVRLSWPSLRDYRSHGFYRFFAFELILVLVLQNVSFWFDDPFSLHQLASWSFLSACTYFVIHGYISLRMIGKPSSKRDDPSLIGIEKTTRLVTLGAFRYIRHPLYSSLLFGTWGVFFKKPSLIGFGLAIVISGLLLTMAKMEEAENVRFFGDDYLQYMKKTKMFIPLLF